MKKLARVLLISLMISTIFCAKGFAAGHIIPRGNYTNFSLQPLGTDGEVIFTPPAPTHVATANIVWKKFEAQLAKRVVQLNPGGTFSYIYKKNGSVKSCDADENTIQFNFSSVGYYQYQVRAVDLDGNFTEWFTYDGVPLGSITTHPGIAVEEEDISPGGGGSSSGSGSDTSSGPGVVQTGTLPAGYQYAVLGPNGEILYYYGGNTSNGIYNGTGYNNGMGYYQQYGGSQVYGSAYANNFQNGSQVLTPNTGVSNYQQVQAPNINGSNYIYSGSTGQSSINNPNYYSGNASTTPASTNMSIAPQITNGMEVGWHVDNNGRFYYQGNGTVLKSTWYLIDQQYYRFGDNGYLLANQWFKDATTGQWYFLSGDGHMLVGWQNINGTWYYFKSDIGQGYGTMYASTAVTINDATWGSGNYAFDANGAMVKNAWYGGHYYGNDGNRTN